MSFKIRDSLSSHSITIIVVITTTTINITVIVSKMHWRRVLKTQRQQPLYDYAALLYSLNYNQQDATLYNILYYCQCSTCFGGFSAHHQELKTVHTASVICQACLLLPLAVEASKERVEQYLYSPLRAFVVCSNVTFTFTFTFLSPISTHIIMLRYVGIRKALVLWITNFAVF
jgi:hypothetical protein